MPTAIQSSRRARPCSSVQHRSETQSVNHTPLLLLLLLMCASVPCTAASKRESSTICSGKGESDPACQKLGQTVSSSSSSGGGYSSRYLAHAAQLTAKADQLLPQKSSDDRGGYVEFLLLVSQADNVPEFKDAQFGPVLVPVMPLEGNRQQQRQQQQQLGPAGDMMRLLAQHKAQFIVSVGDRGDYGFLEQLPAQFRAKTFHIDRPEQLTAAAVESYYWTAIRAPLGGTASEPLLSLFTPAYKSGGKIHIPYESLIQQTYQNWEWVIYDDSPTEHTETWRELSALRDKDVRVRIYKTDRNDAFIGSVKAKACHMATGQMLIELDHDDTLTPDALELLKDALVANPDAGFFYTEAVELYEGTEKTVDYGSNWAFGQGAHYKMLYDGFWATGAIAPPLNHKTLRHIVGVPNHVRAWRREAYLAIGGHSRALPVADDYDLILRAILKYPAVYVRHMTYIQYRQLDGSTFTFTRNALIQRLVNIISSHSDPQIHKALQDRQLEDPGREAMHNYELLWNDAKPTGTPFSRYYHKPTVSAPRDRPYFTVIIPTYNNTRQLQAAVDSVYAQDYHNWELLIVGDHCPVLDAYMEQQKQAVLDGGHVVRYYNMHEHGGPGFHAPLNLAAKVLAPSDWIAYLKADAVWAPDHLKSMAAKIAEDPQRGYVFASLQVHDTVVLATEPSKNQLDLSAMAHHRRLVEKYGGWKSQAVVGAHNDWDVFSRWKDEPWGATLKPTVIYGRQHDGRVNDPLTQQQQQRSMAAAAALKSPGNSRNTQDAPVDNLTTGGRSVVVQGSAQQQHRSQGPAGSRPASVVLVGDESVSEM